APAEDMIRLMERKRYLSPWQGGKLMKGDTDGYILGGYKLLYKIASGSFGRVYRGEDPRTGDIVAVKVLRNKWTIDKQKVDLFLREGKLGMTIRHPNIVSVLAVNQDSKTGQYFIVMEFVEGGNLRDLINIRKKIGVDEALRIMDECAAGLGGAYEKNLTHRDIKPTNILIAATGQAKLVDFGLAEITSGQSMMLERKHEVSDEIAVDRTVDYAGLEKATGAKPGDVRSDIFFLGAVLYEMITGAPLMPVTKDRQAKMMSRRYMDVEDTLRKQGPDLGMSPPLLKLLGKMVSFEPSRRYQNPTQLIDGIHVCRAELAGGGADATRARIPVGPKTLYVVEQNEKLKDAFREKFKAHGYRVLISNDPATAVTRYKQTPYHALLVDARTAGRDGVDAYNRVLRESDAAGLDCGAVLILGADQAHWAADATQKENGAVLVDPGVTMKQLIETLYEVAPGHEAPAAAAPGSP
ncbi:MAG: protein kinase, partial [Gemmataceae bacterium]|nr:protein kinase [Gemmataceae bacterium]